MALQSEWVAPRAVDLNDRPARQLGVLQGAVDVNDRPARQLGVLQGGLADTAAAAGAVAAPAAGADIASIPAPGAGIYQVEVTTLITGGAAGDLTNLELRHGAVAVGRLLGPASPASRRFARITVAAGEAIHVVAVAAGGAGTTYLADISATRIG